MTREEYLLLADKRYDDLQALNQIDNFYDYEKQFVSIWQELGRNVLENNLGTLSKDKCHIAVHRLHFLRTLKNYQKMGSP